MFDHCLYFNTTALARVVERAWSAAYRPFGLTPSQGFLLRLVMAEPQRAQHELATALTISRPTATRLIDGLEKLGLVERRANPMDARRCAVSPTRRAMAMRAALDDASAAVTRRIQRHIGKGTFDDTVSAVRSACRALK